MGSKVPPNSAMFMECSQQSSSRSGDSNLLWLLGIVHVLRALRLQIIFHLVGILDEEHRLPDVVIRQHALPAGHGGVTSAILDDIKEVRVRIVGSVTYELRHRGIKIVAQR